MFQGMIDNAGTILVSLILAAVIVGIVISIRKDRKQGKSSCGCSCGSCPMSGSCHRQS